MGLGFRPDVGSSGNLALGSSACSRSIFSTRGEDKLAGKGIKAHDEIRVCIVDDHALVRQGLARVLELEPRIQVVGEAGDGLGAISLANELRPDVILMDINMPGTDGIEASRIINRDHPNTRIIALTVYDDDRVFEVIRAGVSAYILKDVEAEELIRAIIDVHEGRSIIHPRVTGKVLGEFTRLSNSEGDGSHLDRLTQREREVLELIAKGEANREIANRLYISEKTVKNHITSILRKLNVHDRTQAAIYAIKCKLVEP
ncbi:MAG: response regulator transcription factor [Syntrophomonadaceae bacterium]|nr:response regulator transcription factor [Syntrophomonadaceae bacterium]